VPFIRKEVKGSSCIHGLDGCTSGLWRQGVTCYRKVVSGAVWGPRIQRRALKSKCLAQDADMQRSSHARICGTIDE